MRISTQWSPVEMTDQKQLKNVEFFNYFSSMTANAATSTMKLNPWQPWQNQQSTIRPFPPATEHKCMEETSNVLHLEHSFVRHWKLNTLESRSEIPGKFSNVVLEKWRSFELITGGGGGVSHTHTQSRTKGISYPEYNKGRLTGLVIFCIQTAF